jgi:hypothetical protein
LALGGRPLLVFSLDISEFGTLHWSSRWPAGFCDAVRTSVMVPRMSASVVGSGVFLPRPVAVDADLGSAQPRRTQRTSVTQPANSKFRLRTSTIPLAPPPSSSTLPDAHPDDAKQPTAWVRVHPYLGSCDSPSPTDCAADFGLLPAEVAFVITFGSEERGPHAGIVVLRLRCAGRARGLGV